MHAALARGGHAIVSGILSSEREMMLAAAASDWRVVDEDSEDIWWSGTLTPR
jgi:ribosomal protein L11 methylase PrmA